MAAEGVSSKTDEGELVAAVTVIKEASAMEEWLSKHKDDGFLVDVLPKGSYDYQHIPGAVHGDFFEDGWVDAIGKLAEGKAAKDTPLCVYCSDTRCPTSKKAANKLVELGYTDVSKFAGGLAEWESAELDFAGDIENE